ncbi:hypothetical protein BaRGS_00028574 [Batillaria attramentaria]|uniref:Uncharacterized protein n=1 Tax=Batillaria attramentaria TaxID=370345 RepID=A0ABD0JZH6_9CAEN
MSASSVNWAWLHSAKLSNRVGGSRCPRSQPQSYTAMQKINRRSRRVNVRPETQSRYGTATRSANRDRPQHTTHYVS